MMKGETIMGCWGDIDLAKRWRRIKPLRDAYRKKLIAKGIHPRSLKMDKLMLRKFSSTWA